MDYATLHHSFTDDGVQVRASRYCEVVLSGTDECNVLDRLAAWTRKHGNSFRIVGLHWPVEWIPDPAACVEGDEIQLYIVTMQFKHGVHEDLDWGKG
jgi:hypothetical protein